MPLCSHGSVCVVILVQKRFFCSMGHVWAAELGAELLNVIVSLLRLCLVIIIIEFLIKTVFRLMAFSVIQ